MVQAKRNKEFIVNYVNSLSGKQKTREAIEQYTSDELLIEHILFLDTVFPGYEILIDEVTGEHNRVIVRARVHGTHQGQLNGVPPTNREVLFPIVVGYEIEHRKIIDHWLITDHVILMEQLGVTTHIQQ